MRSLFWQISSPLFHCRFALASPTSYFRILFITYFIYYINVQAPVKKKQSWQWLASCPLHTQKKSNNLPLNWCRLKGHKTFRLFCFFLSEIRPELEQRPNQQSTIIFIYFMYTLKTKNKTPSWIYSIYSQMSTRFVLYVQQDLMMYIHYTINESLNKIPLGRAQDQWHCEAGMLPAALSGCMWFN